jgi:hypothetical protein
VIAELVSKPTEPVRDSMDQPLGARKALPLRRAVDLTRLVQRSRRSDGDQAPEPVVFRRASEPSVDRMNSQEPCCRLKVSLFDGWPDNDAITSDVRSETTQGYGPASDAKERPFGPLSPAPIRIPPTITAL